MISIITPTHKKGKFWDLTVESIMQQTCLDFEWVVLDNSEDFYFKKDFENFKKLHPEYNEAYKNVKIFEEKSIPNKPVAYYKNRCVELTSCSDNDFVLVFDHDDFMFKTAVEDFVNCINKYGNSIDYITGDGINVENIDDQYIPMTNFNRHTTKPKKNFDNLTIGNNFTLAFSEIEIPQITKFNYETYDFLISSHPRAIRKRFLKNNVFRFYENSRLEEDTMQVFLAPIMLNVGWINRGTIVYVVYKDNDGYKNACANKTEMDYLEHDQINRGMCLAYEGFRKLFKNRTANSFYIYNDFETKDKEEKPVKKNATKKQASGKSKKK